MRTYMVEILITEPRGEKLDDWGYIGKTFEDLPEGFTQADLDTLNFRIRKMIEEYERKEKDNGVHKPTTVSS